jgi:hypothetical protein
MWRRVEFLALPTADTANFHQDHRFLSQSRAFNTVAVPGALRTYVLRSAVIKFLTAEGFTPIFLDVPEACTVRVPFMFAQTLGPSFLRGAERDPGDRAHSHGSDVGGLIRCFGVLPHHERGTTRRRTE